MAEKTVVPARVVSCRDTQKNRIFAEKMRCETLNKLSILLLRGEIEVFSMGIREARETVLGRRGSSRADARTIVL